MFERYTNIEIFRLEFEKVVLEHESISHMEFNDDNTYKNLMNEVPGGSESFESVCAVTRFASLRF